MNMSQIFINVITLNCWGIPYVSKNRKERMDAIATYLSNGFHDIVGLQEIWDEKDFTNIKSKISNVLPYSHYFYSGVFGSGVCVFSKWPIEEVFFHAWPLNGYVHMVHHGDWFGGKGVGLCRIKYNDLNINFYSAHLHAEYSTEDIYLGHRVLQAFNTAEFIKMTSSSGHINILAGDLNVQPHDLAYKIICQTGILTDSWESSLSEEAQKRSHCHKNGTIERWGNSYSDPENADRFPEGKRIDYILYNSGSQYTVEVTDYRLPLPDEVPGQKFSYSDHDAVAAKLSVQQSPSADSQPLPEIYMKTLEDSMNVCKSSLSTLKHTSRKYLIYALSLFIILMSTVGMAERTYVDIPRLLLVITMFYFLVMGTLWNMMESNGVLAGQKGMEIIYNSLARKVVDNPAASSSHKD